MSRDSSLDRLQPLKVHKQPVQYTVGQLQDVPKYCINYVSPYFNTKKSRNREESSGNVPLVIFHFSCLPFWSLSILVYVGY